MSSDRFTTPALSATSGRVGQSCALPTLTLLLTIGSLPLPLRDHCSG
jgi:hypothetical protein